MADLKGNFITNEVALRKESVDRNFVAAVMAAPNTVALRKESVDRNCLAYIDPEQMQRSLSARRAWIEITAGFDCVSDESWCRSPQGERG